MIRRTLSACCLALALAVPASAATVIVQGTINIVPLDIATVTTGGTAVTALAAGKRTAGGWIQNPAGAAQPLCINEQGGVASGTTSSNGLLCLPAGNSFNLAPSLLGVSVVSSDSAHPFAGEGYMQ